MKCSKLIIVLLLMVSATALALTPEEEKAEEIKKNCFPADMAALQAVLDKPEPCTLPDQNGVKKFNLFVGGKYLLKTPIVFPANSVIFGPISDPSKYPVFEVDLPYVDGEKKCAITVSDTSSLLGIKIIPTQPVSGVPHQAYPAVCIKGKKTVVGALIEKNNGSQFIHGMVVDGDNNIISGNFETLSSGVTFNSGKGNWVGKSTFSTHAECVKENDKCVDYLGNAGSVVMLSADNTAVNNTFKSGLAIYFGYTDGDQKVKPLYSMEAAANILSFNKLSENDLTQSNFSLLYKEMLGMSLPLCTQVPEKNGIQYKYIYIKTKDGLVAVCASGESVKPMCPEKNSFGECACPSNLVMTADKKCVEPPKKDESPPIKCTADQVLLLDGSCGKECGPNQNQKQNMGQNICSCMAGYVPTTDNKCVGNTGFDINLPAPGSGGGDCRLNPDQLPNPVALGIILFLILSRRLRNHMLARQHVQKNHRKSSPGAGRRHGHDHPKL